MGSVYRQEGCVCSICKTARSKQLCGACVVKDLGISLDSVRRKDAIEASASLQARLERAFRSREDARAQEDELTEAKQRLQQARLKLHRFEVQKAAVNDEVQSLQQELEARQSSLQEKQSQVGDTRELLAKGQSAQKDYENVLSSLASKLANLTRDRLGTVMEILPLSVDQAFQTSARRETTQTRGIRPVFICGCQLPSTASEPLDSLRKERYNAALGYMVLLIEVLSSLLNTPLLFQPSFQSSTSSLWLKKGFWNEGAPSKARTFKLYHEASEKTFNSTSQRPASNNGPSSALSVLKQRLHWETRVHQPQNSVKDLTDLREAENLKSAILHLWRGIGVLGSGHPAFQPSRPPFNALLDFCWQIAMRPRSDYPGAMSILAQSNLIGRPLDSVLAPNAHIQDGDAEEVDGWDMIQRPFQTSSILRSQIHSSAMNLMMPPPPSDSEEIIRHWEKANFSTPQEGYFSPYLKPYKISKHVLPLRQTAFNAADRLFQTFRGT